AGDHHEFRRDFGLPEPSTDDREILNKDIDLTCLQRKKLPGRIGKLHGIESHFPDVVAAGCGGEGPNFKPFRFHVIERGEVKVLAGHQSLTGIKIGFREIDVLFAFVGDRHACCSKIAFSGIQDCSTFDQGEVNIDDLLSYSEISCCKIDDVYIES